VKSVSIDSTNVRIYYPKMKTVQEYALARTRICWISSASRFGATSGELKNHYDVTLVGTEQIGVGNTWHLHSSEVGRCAEESEESRALDLGGYWPAMQQKFTVSTTGDYQLMTYSNMHPNKVFQTIS